MKIDWQIVFMLVLMLVMVALIGMLIVFHKNTCVFCGKQESTIKMSEMSIGKGNRLNVCEKCSIEIVKERLSKRVSE